MAKKNQGGYDVEPFELVLYVRREEMDAFETGEKTSTLRPWSPYWRRRLEGVHYDRVTLISGGRRMTFAWVAISVDIGRPPGLDRAVSCFKIHLKNILPPP